MLKQKIITVLCYFFAVVAAVSALLAVAAALGGGGGFIDLSGFVAIVLLHVAGITCFISVALTFVNIYFRKHLQKRG